MGCITKDTYFQGTNNVGSKLFFENSNNSDLKISDSAFKSLAVDTKSGNFKNLFIDNVVVDKLGDLGRYQPLFVAAQSVSIKNLSLFGDVYDTNTKLARAKKVTIDGLYLDKGHVSVEAEEVTFKNLSFGSKPYLDYYLISGGRENEEFGTSVLTSEITFAAGTDLSQGKNLLLQKLIINNNAVDSITQIPKLSLSNVTWNPTSLKDLNNNVQSISFAWGSLYTDNLAGYENEFSLSGSTLLHGDGINAFETHYLPKNTKLHSFYFNYSLDDKAYYMATHEDILRFQKRSKEIAVKIEDGGNGGLVNSVEWYNKNYSYRDTGALNWNNSYYFDRQYATPDGIATIYYDVTLNSAKEGDKEMTADYKLYRININPGKYFSLIGNIGSASEYISLDNGFTGAGGLNLVAETDEDGNTVDTAIYLGGDANSYTGATIVNSDVTLHLENADSISASKELVLYGNANFVVDNSTGTGNEFTNFDKVTLVGTSSTGADGATQTQISGGGSTIKLDGTGKHFSFFQEDSLHPDAPSTAANFAPANYPVTYSSLLTHHTVDVTKLDVEILNGASLLVNYLGKTVGGNLKPSEQDNMRDLAILALGEDANVLIDGYSAGSNTSAHLYMGNGIIRLDSGSSLTLAGGAVIHFSAHRDGMFEYPYNDDGTPITGLADDHKHASIELNGGTLNLELDAQSHLYSDHILSAKHKHFLIGAAQVDSNGDPITSPVTVADSVTFSLTEEAVKRIDSLVPDTITQDWANKNNITLEQAQQLQTIYKNEGGKYTALLTAITDTGSPSSIADLKAEFEKAGGNSDDFNDLMSSLVTLGMNNDVHGFMFPKYGVQFTENGAYMYVLESLTAEDFIKQTGINVSIINEVNEVLDTLVNGNPSDYANSGAFEIINNALDTITGQQSYEATVAAARTMDSAAQLATVAGTQTLAWDMLQTRIDSTQRHLDSIKNLPSNKLHLWADFLYMHNSSHNMWTDVNGERDVQADLGGFIAGGDYRYNENAVAGASFSFMGGTAETTLGKTYSLDVNNDVYGIAGSVYAQYDFAPSWRVRGDVAYQYTNNDVEMIFPALYNISDKLTAEVGTNAVQALVAVEKDMNLSDTIVLTPYLGVKYTYLRTDGYTSKLGAKDAFTTDAADQHIVSVPVA